MQKYKIDSNVVAFVISTHRWGNRKVADKKKVETKADKKMMSVTKKLIDSPEYKAIIDHMRITKLTITDRMVQSFYLKGVYFSRLEQVEGIKAYLDERNNGDGKEEKGLKALVEEFAKVWDIRKAEAPALLGDQYNKNDYPTAEYVKNSFGIESRWISFDVPDKLPDAVYKEEKKKAEEKWQECAERITMSLRQAFKDLIAHAVDKLTTAKGEKPKKFKDATIDNINDFIDTFANKNITNDKELEELIKKAKKVVNGVDADDIRDDRFVRLAVKKGFAAIDGELENITRKPTRKFDFGD